MRPEQLLEEFAEEYRRRGGADPRPYLARAEGAQRAELQVLIEAFLERAPRREWDPATFAGSVAERAAARAEVGAAPAGWPALLPALRAKAALKRRTVVERLATALGFPGEEERVAVYYHLMERGRLAPAGVSSQVLEALASILGATAAELRRSGEAGQRAAEAGGEVFARVAAGADGASAPPAPAGTEAPAGSRQDELDRLFTGGDDAR